MIWVYLTLLIPILAYIFLPLSAVGLGLTLLEMYRNYLGKKRLKFVEELWCKRFKKRKYALEALDEFLSKHSKEVIVTEGNIALNIILNDASPSIKSSFPENRVWIYKLDRIYMKHLFRKYKVENMPNFNKYF